MPPVRELLGRLLRGIVSGTLLAAVALGIAGRLDLPMLNLFVGGCVVVVLLSSLILDADRLRERQRWKQHGEDPARLVAIRLLVAAEFVVGLLDVGRLHLTRPVPFALQASACAVAFAGSLWTLWAIAVNRFFVPVIRMQPEGGHRVVSQGPYARVRHPGYAGMVAVLPASALALGSWWAVIPAVVAAWLFVRRAAHEDRFLSEHLEGYRQYTQRVPFRLLPGMWVLSLALLSTPSAAVAGDLFHPTPREDLRELSTDRPDRTESPFTVDAGHVQAEIDLVAHTRERSHGVRSDRLSAATTNLKLGLLERADLQLIVEPWSRQAVRVSGIAEDERSGFGDVTTRLKVNLWGNDGGSTALALMPFVKLPTNQNDLGNDAVEGGLIAPLAVELPNGIGLGLMAELDLIRDGDDAGHHSEWITTATLSRDLRGRLAGFVELFSAHSAEAGGEWVGTADAGLVYALTPDVQLDGGAYVGLSEASEDLTLFLGLTVRR